MATEFTCQECRDKFTVEQSILARYPGWTPKKCLKCKGPRRDVKPVRRQKELDTYPDGPAGPNSGIFTDGYCEPNPGNGGWGVVKVANGEIIAERSGRDPDTTNNRMELQALIEAFKLISESETVTVYSDSELSVKTVSEWAAAWKKNGWTRGKKRQPIRNLDLVQELHELAQARPHAKVEWIKGHAGLRWNEHADALSKAVALVGEPVHA